MEKIIPLAEVRWLNEKRGDELGYVFSWRDEIYRAIHPGAVPTVRSLFERGIISELVKRGWLVGTAETDLTLEGFGLVLKHQRAPFFTSGFEWPTSLLRDAARTWVEINLALQPYGLALSDAHPFNFGQIDACRPVWLDLGSLRPLNAPEQGFPQFRRFFLHPLRLIAADRRLSRLARVLIRTGGIEDDEIQRLIPALLPARLRRVSAWVRRVRQALAGKPPAAGPGIPPDLSARGARLEALRDELETLPLGVGQSYWGDYQRRHNLTHESLDAPPPNQRTAAILQAIETLNPRRVIDLAGNAGYFSFFAARRGAEVLAVDLDEPSVEKLYTWVRAENPPWQIACAVRDITEPLDPGRAIVAERRADLVLALAITHHLCMAEGYTFEFVARLLARYSTDAVLVEFMPFGRGVEAPKPDPLPEWYTLEKFLATLRLHFTSAEVIADHHEAAWRILILCKGSR